MTMTDTSDGHVDIRQLHDDLVSLHGQPERTHSRDGVRQLFATALSQTVTDEQTAHDELVERTALSGRTNHQAPGTLAEVCKELCGPET